MALPSTAAASKTYGDITYLGPCPHPRNERVRLASMQGYMKFLCPRCGAEEWTPE